MLIFIQFISFRFKYELFICLSLIISYGLAKRISNDHKPHKSIDFRTHFEIDKENQDSKKKTKNIENIKNEKEEVA